MPSSDPSQDPPRRIGDYIIHRVLGQGGMGTVYEAEEQLSRRRVALKILRSELSQTERGRRQFVTEMGILASLDDPHIVRCLHCTEVDGQLLMALEYLEGQTLREVLTARGALPWPEVASHAWQISAALRVAHSREPAVIHRDLKPENVMCLPDGRVKVMDFGIAKIIQAMSGATSGSPVGTMRYMSPEQIDARPLDGRSDLYALGLVMWELLAGRPPFESESPRVLLEKLCTEPAPRLPEYARAGLPPSLEQLIARLLEKDPAARPRDADEVLAILDATRPQPAAAPAASFVPPQPMPGPISMPISAPASTGAVPHQRPAQLDTIGIVEHATRGHEPTRRVVPIVIATGLLLLTTALIGWFFIRPLLGPEQPQSASAATPVSPAESTQPKSPAPPPGPTPTPACESQSKRWEGAWELRTLATKAIKSNWIGGSSFNELSLEVDGCQLSGSGRKLLDGKERWSFTLEGTVADDGTAQLRYDVVGRKIAGTWKIAPDGNGTWASAADDVSGTLTVTRAGG